MNFISFSLLNAMFRTSNTTLNRSDKSGHPCLIPNFRGKASSFSTECEVSCGSVINCLYYVEMCSLYTYFDESCFCFCFFIMSGCWILLNAFIMSFFFFSGNTNISVTMFLFLIVLFHLVWACWCYIQFEALHITTFFYQNLDSFVLCFVTLNLIYTLYFSWLSLTVFPREGVIANFFQLWVEVQFLHPHYDCWVGAGVLTPTREGSHVTSLGGRGPMFHTLAHMAYTDIIGR